MTTGNVEWWRTTATHLWRTYFALIRDGTSYEDMTDTNRRIWDLCDRIYRERFVTADQDILKTYFTSRWGDDIYVVEDYSLRHNIPIKVVWMIIRRANRTVTEELGILERKEDKTDE